MPADPGDPPDPYVLLRRFVEVCDRLGVRYFVAGSMASSTYGEFRLTQDVDVVVDLAPEQLRPLFEAFDPDEFYLSEPAMRQAIASGGQFNIIPVGEIVKIDVFTPADTPFTRSQFARALEGVSPEGVRTRVASAEDVIVMKLVYYEEGGSEKHVRDITSMLRVQGDAIDRAYVERWAEELGVSAAWRVVLEKLTTGDSAPPPGRPPAR